jgi:hypothetical protein
MPAVPKRRWLRFSLRTMLVMSAGVAILFSWVGSNAMLVRERQLMRQSLSSFNYMDERRSAFLADMRSLPRKFPNDSSLRMHYDSTVPYRLPFIRQWLGDRLVRVFYLRQGPNIDEVRRLFPEALILVRRKPAGEDSSNSRANRSAFWDAMRRAMPSDPSDLNTGATGK